MQTNSNTRPAHALPQMAALMAALIFTGCCSKPGGQHLAVKSNPTPSQTTRTAKTSSERSGRPLREATIEIDGKQIAGWNETDFAGRGEVTVEPDRILLNMGHMTGITWTNAFPKSDYEVNLEAARIDGSDFFCGITFPVGEKTCSFIVGGWGGGVVGLSSLDGEDASSNETTKYMNFEKGRWYQVRVRVTKSSIQTWIDNEKMADVETTDRKISIRNEVELSKPFGISTWSTTGAVRNIKVKSLPGK